MIDAGSPRAREMVARLVREWADAGLADADVDSLHRRAAEVMRERSARFADEHHPAFLHPLRTVTLLAEAGELSLVAHAAALSVDTESAGGAPVTSDAPTEVADLVGTAPAEMLEELLMAEPWVRRVWLAERLDQIRHLHLWAGEARTAAALALAGERELPLAHREGGRLARAWTDWMDKAERYRLVSRAKLCRIRGEPPS